MLQHPKARLLALSLPVVVGGLLLALPLAAETAHSPDLFVGRFFGSDVQRFYGPQSTVRGAPHPSPGSGGAEYSKVVVARRPWGLAFGPDGNLYIANQQGGDGGVMRLTGPFALDPGAAAPAPGPPPEPGLAVDAFVPRGNFYTVAFGLDQNLYAGGVGAVQRFDVATGAAVDAPVAGAPPGEFTHGRVPHTVEGIAFGPDQNLYVASYNSCAPGPTCSTTSGEILRFDGKTGAFIDVFVADGSGGLEHPGGIGFGTGGDLFVCNELFDATGGGEVLRFHGPLNATPGAPFPAAGQAAAHFAGSPGVTPFQLTFGPDRTLYVSYDAGVIAYNGRNGVEQSRFAAVSDARGLAFYNGSR